MDNEVIKRLIEHALSARKNSYAPYSRFRVGAALLASDGMIVKRPLLITDKTVLTGFKEKEWEEALDA